MVNGFIYITISDINDENCISANYDPKNGKCYMPFIHLDKKGANVVWDNFDYVVNTFYSFLERWQARKLELEDEEEFKEIWHLLNESWVADIKEIIEQAVELGWDKLD